MRSWRALLGASACPDRGLGRRQPRHRDAERAARHVVEPQLVTPVDRVGVSPMLAADPDLPALARLAPLVHGNPQQSPYSLLAGRLERVARQGLLSPVADAER